MDSNGSISICLTPLNSHELTWTHMGSPTLLYTHLESLGLAWTHLDSLGLTWSHLVSFGLVWSPLASLGLAWAHPGPIGLTWSHLDPLGPSWKHLVTLGLVRIRSDVTWGSHSFHIDLILPQGTMQQLSHRKEKSETHATNGLMGNQCATFQARSRPNSRGSTLADKK